jgi:hypothetical protein
MIALDASAVVEMLRGGPLADSLWQDILESGYPVTFRENGVPE